MSIPAPHHPQNTDKQFLPRAAGTLLAAATLLLAAASTAAAAGNSNNNGAATTQAQQQPEPVTLRLKAGTQSKPARAEIYGHNTTSGDWHGNYSNNRPPILWDAQAQAPDPAWDGLTHAWPLRVIRYHAGNFYPWRDAVGPIEERGQIRDDYRRALRKDAGLQEFLLWRESLATNGNPAPEVVLIASPFRPVEELADLVAYCNATTGPMAELRAAHGHPEPYNVRYWELGNETDWVHRDDLDITRAETERELKNKLLPAEYVELCRERALAMRAVDPTIQLIAHAQTAPWPSSNPNWRQWHREVISGMGDLIDAIAIHPYYDGYNVPYVLASVDAVIEDIRELQPQGRDITVAITEHARWVNYNNLAERPQSWGLQGAISAGDFLLRVMDRPEVSMANYWCYLHRGPWRVLNADWEDGAQNKFGTGAYMLFGLLNAALLPQFELLTPEPPNAARGKGYPYQVTAARFSDPASGANSVVAINRSADTAATLLIDNLPAPAGGKAVFSIVTADSLTDTNVPETPEAVTLQTETVDLPAGQPLQLQVPARSIVSWRW